MYGAKSFYLTVSFYEDINDPIILKTTHIIEYNLLLSNVLDESLVSVEHLDCFDSLSWEKNYHFSSSLAKKEKFIPRSIGVDKDEFDLVTDSDLANSEDNFAVVADAWRTV